MDNCCESKKEQRGLLKGILYGLLPHTFCIGFVIFSIAGSALATGFFRNFLLIPYFFQALVIISFIMATISAIFYLKRNKCLCKNGIKTKWKYLTTLYTATIVANLIMFFYIFPAMANFRNADIKDVILADLQIKVGIPCTGHAPLITDELKKDSGIKNITFSAPNIFNIKYNPQQTTKEKIKESEIFKTYKVENN